MCLYFSRLSGRFAAAISHLEILGILRLSANSTQIQRLVYAWDVTA
jgi:hypothetical protein